MNTRAILSGAMHCLAPLVLLASGLAAQNGDGEYGCPIKLEDDPFPPMRIEATVVGFTDSGYARADLPVPGPIPMGIHGTDIDSVLVKCAGGCSPVFYGVPVNGRWTVTSNGGNPGTFIRPDATTVAPLDNYMRVLYLPPSDLAPGQSRICEVKAFLTDNECGVTDPEQAWSIIRVTIDRFVNGRYQVVASMGASFNPQFDPKPCEGESGDCDLLMSLQIPPPPSVVPQAPPGILVGELRSLNCVPSDTDRLLGECGTPPGTSPVIHNPFAKDLCDSFKYSWRVVPMPGDTGSGYFIGPFSRSPLFGALTPGQVTVEVYVSTLDGEVATGQVSFMIYEPKCKQLSFNSSDTVVQDAGGTPYAAPHWKDGNDNGLATDVNVGDRNFPVAFRKGQQLKLRDIEITVPIPPMPGDGLLGTTTGANETYSAWSLSYTPGTSGGAASTNQLSTSGNAYTVCRYFAPYRIDWALGPVGSTTTVVFGRTENKLYVTLAGPGDQHAGRRHTTYEVACKNNDGLSDVATCRTNIWSQFIGRNLPRVSPDGFNNTVPEPTPGSSAITYWGAGAGTPQTADGMLNAGHGTCVAWSVFLMRCFDLQGIPSKRYEVRLPGNPLNGMFFVNSWTAPGAAPFLASHFLATPPTGGVVDVVGIGGQGNNDPVAHFVNHFIIESAGSIYDPSYGAGPFPGWPGGAQKTWENAGLYGLSANVLSTTPNLTLNKAGVDLQYTP